MESWAEKMGLVEIVELDFTEMVRKYLAEIWTKKILYIKYKISDKEGNYEPINTDGGEYNCMYCLRAIKDRVYGIPIYKSVTTASIQYHTVDVFCRIDCCAAEIKRRMQNPLYSMSMQYLDEIMVTEEGGKKMKLAPDQRLLQIFNGPLTWDEFHAPQVKYSEKTGNICIIPIYNDS